MKYDFFTGSYGDRGEEGICKFCFDSKKGELRKVSGYSGIYHPSWVCFNRKDSILYAVQEETPAGAMQILRVVDKGFKRIQICDSDGADPCHLSMSEEGDSLFLSNYSSGSLVAYPLDPNGLPAGKADQVQHYGKGIDLERQEAPHVHSCVEHKGMIYASDLGLDQVFIYGLNKKTHRIEDTGNRIHVSPGAGPRHLEFYSGEQSALYVLCEMGNSISVFWNRGNTYECIQNISTLPAGFAGMNTAAAIHRSGKLLFASNRGHDSIAMYEIKNAGELDLLDIVPTGGKIPRDFAVFDAYLIAANQESDCLSVLRIDEERKALELTDIKAETVRPTCICRC